MSHKRHPLTGFSQFLFLKRYPCIVAVKQVGCLLLPGRIHRSVGKRRLTVDAVDSDRRAFLSRLQYRPINAAETTTGPVNNHTHMIDLAVDLSIIQELFGIEEGVTQIGPGPFIGHRIIARRKTEHSFRPPFDFRRGRSASDGADKHCLYAIG